MLKDIPPHAIAIVGLAGRFPDAQGLDDFWRNIREGVESLQVFSDADLESAGVPAALRTNPLYVSKGTVLQDADHFDAAFFGIAPREAQVLDPQHRIFLECASQALEHAGYGSSVGDQSVGVYAGASMNTYLLMQILRNIAFAESVGGYQIMLGNDKDFLCTRVSYKLDLHGPSMTVQTACSTSLVAVEVACRALQRGECDMALAGGVSVTFPQRAGYLFQEGMILSPDGHCRPFDAAARGTRAGAGAGIVVLKRFADAVNDGDTIHAVIRGAAINNDGSGKAGYTAPSVDGQIEVIATAQSLAAVDARSISYIEAHGTGTPLGDPIEIAALTQVFRASSEDVGFCRLGSLKANLGHLDAAAGVAGLIKTVLALQHREIPPLVNFRSPNPQLELQSSPFTASAQGSEWVSNGSPRRAGVSSFGIGGTNAHVILEEAPPATPSIPVWTAHLLVISAKTQTALDQASANLLAHLGAHPEQSLADVEWTLQAGRTAFGHRRALVAKDSAQAISLLSHPQRAPVLSGVHESGVRPVAFLFSGQGSQHVGMGAGLYRTEHIYREAIDRCAALLEPDLGVDIRTLIFGNEADTAINETRLTQPALFVTEFALASLWMEWGLVPAAMLGHSIGEYVAAHLAGVLSLQDALSIVAARGRLMQALPPGSMAAVQLPASQIKAWLGGGVEIAAINGPELCTLSGPSQAMTALLERMQKSGVDSRPLHTSHAFHSAMMEPALAPFRELLGQVTLSVPSIPYVSNLTGTWITPDQATSPDYYAQHLRQAVQFEAGVRTLTADPGLFLLEVGPGNVLTSLARMTVGKDGQRRVIASLSHPRDKRADVESILDAGARLWIGGAPLDWTRMHADARLHRVPLPTYPFERKRHWVEAVAGAAVSTAERPDQGGEQRYDNMDDWLHAPTWLRDDSLAGWTPQLQDHWLVLAEEGPLADAVSAGITAAGATPIRVLRGDKFMREQESAYRVRPGNAEDIMSVVRDLQDAGANRVAGALNLWSLTMDCGRPQIAYEELVALAAGLEPFTSQSSMQVVSATQGGQSVLDEAVRQPQAAVLLGPALVLPLEIPGLRLRSVDVESGAAAQAAALIAELQSRDAEAVIAYRLGRRWVRRFERLHLPDDSSPSQPIKTQGVYLITGGLGGIGLVMARWLAKEFSARLLLTARTAMPPRQQWDAWLQTHPGADRQSVAIRAIREIEESGGEVLDAAADAADEAAMARAIGEARARWGAIDGVIHAAGIAGAGTIALRASPDEICSLLAPKVQGLNVLARLLGDSCLDFLVLMSSINAVNGLAGACGYASANAILDVYADSTERPAKWKHVVAFNWGPWSDVGMAVNLVVPEARRAHWQAEVSAGIPSAAGVEILRRVLASPRSRVVVLPFDVERVGQRTRAYLAGAAVVDRSSPASIPNAVAVTSSRPDLSSEYQAPHSDLQLRLATIWVELLGVEGIGIHDDFFELGGHSLLATRVLARIDDLLGVRLALRDIFDAPTIHRLAERIGAADTVAVADDREEIEF